ncbi:TerB family tellurite resistance protein [Flavobacterium sp. CBA20B-1]|uniref:tellurite resistance TerB family protein n=1 Tax=unclassified Flavobacterium TaxID=196869 RepID=UPI0022258E14|nr:MULTISPECIES: TerB family tellurite resistance protein [unclassified Flavobacterium]WCM41079.1 TerB family tellurite resistance protein [Flavobacterium sp. CBA20B-1]
MSYQDIYDSGLKERNKGHFASIVRIAFSDGKYTETERQFIEALASKLDITEEDFKSILEDPTKYPVNPPYLQERRIERLFDLAHIVFINHILGPEQKAILQKFASALGFVGDIRAITNKALSLLVMEYSLEDFKLEMDLYIKTISEKAS